MRTEPYFFSAISPTTRSSEASGRTTVYWGFGDAAGNQAGKMRQSGRMWVLLPRDCPMSPVARR